MNNKISVAILALTVSGVSAQGLFNIAPNDEAHESKTISYTAGVTVGYDDLINPNSASADSGVSSAYVSAFIGASAVRVNTRQTLEYFARYASIYHLDKVEGGENLSNNISAGVNFTQRISERLRFTSNNHLAYQLEPDYEYGLANVRTSDEYLSWSSDNSIGYRFTERVGMYAGVNFNGVNYSGSQSVSNRVGYSAYLQGRYQATERTVLTAGYTYASSNNNSRPDSVSHIFSAGAEHRLSENAIVVMRAGVQEYNVEDGGASSTSPYFEAAYRAKLNSRTSVRSFARYSISDYDTSFPGDTSYDRNNSIRVGIAANHTATSRLTVNGGVDYVSADREDGRRSGVLGGLADEKDEILNVYLGFGYKLYKNTYLTGSYNYTESLDSSSVNNYNRSRYNMGVKYTW